MLNPENQIIYIHSLTHPLHYWKSEEEIAESETDEEIGWFMNMAVSGVGKEAAPEEITGVTLFCFDKEMAFKTFEKVDTFLRENPGEPYPQINGEQVVN